MKVVISILMLVSYAQASVASYGMNPVGGMPVLEEKEITLKDMPNTRSSDSVGLCGAFSTALLIDQANCEAKKAKEVEEKKIPSSCANMSDNERASPLDLSRYSEEIEEKDADDRSAYKNGLIEGGFAAVVLNNAMRTEQIATEACAPFVQITAGIENPDAVEGGLWKRFSSVFEKKQKNSNDFCPTCEAQASSIKREFSLQADNKDILKSFGETTYDKFLDKLLVPRQCGRSEALVLNGKWEAVTYPSENSFPPGATEKQKNDLIAGQIKKVLTDLKRPVSIDFCTDVPFDNKKKCGAGHAVAIKGYRKVCKKKDLQECRNMFQIQNSWGETWQTKNNDGWVDGDELMKRTYYYKSSFAWIKDKDVKEAALKK